MSSQCTICGIQGVIEEKIDETSLYRCPSCGHCFTDIDSIRIQEKYDQSYFDQEHRNWFNNPNLPLFEKLAEIINKHKPDASLIDIGCGNGDFLKYLHKSNPRLSLTGIDLVADNKAEGVNFISGNIMTAKLERQYDVIVCLAVIEHIPGIGFFMQNIYDMCSAGGLVIIMTVNDSGLLYGLARFAKKWGYTVPYRRLYSKHHVNHFNVASLRHLMELSKLDVIDVLRHNTVIAAVDVSSSSQFVRLVLKLVIAGIFCVSKISGKTYLQTIICRKGFDAIETTSSAVSQSAL